MSQQQPHLSENLLNSLAQSTNSDLDFLFQQTNKDDDR